MFFFFFFYLGEIFCIFSGLFSSNFYPSILHQRELLLQLLNPFLLSIIQDSIDVNSGEPYVVTLEPGDVLFVPHKWWHYVQHLTVGVSVNTWIQLDNVSIENVSGTY